MKNLDHDKLIELVQTFAPRISDCGVCHGFSSMLAQAAITGKKELNEFFVRLDLISKYFEDPNNNPMTLKQEVDALFEAHTPDPITKEVPSFTEDELLKIQVRAFAEAVAIQQGPQFLGIFDSINQDDDRLYPLTASKALEKQLEETESARLKKDLVGILGLDLSGLVDYLEKMKVALEKQQSPQDFAFILSSDDHSIHLNFDSETSKWHLTDINYLRGKENYYFEVNSDELAPIIFNSFNDENSAHTFFSINSVSFGKNPEAIQSFTNISNQLMPDSINRFNSRGVTTLHCAASLGQLDLVKLLLENGADVNTPDKDGHTPLHKAASAGHLEVVEFLLKNGADILAPNLYGNSPLNCAAYSGYLEVVEFALKNGADIMNRNKNGDTPLHIAASNGHLEVVEVFLKNRADIKTKNTKGETPLHLAAYSGDIEIVEILLKNGADIMNRNKNGDTPLHIAACNGHLEVVEFLLKNTADINAKNTKGETPLHLAANYGQLEAVEFLLKNRADIKAPDKYGNSPLHNAAYYGDIEVVKFLLDNEADIMAQNKNGETPLDRAASEGNLEVVEFLLKNRADIKTPDKYGNSPLHNTAYYGDIEVVKFLSEKMEALSAPTTKTVIFSSMKTTTPLTTPKRETSVFNEENVSSEQNRKKF